MSFKSTLRLIPSWRWAREAAMGFTPTFSPADLPGLALWLRSDLGTWQDPAMTVPAVLNGDVVGGWADQSGNTNDVTQAVVAKRGSLQTGANGINGLSVVRFDGTDDLLVGANFLNGASGSIFAVYRLIAALINNQTVLSSCDTASNVREISIRGYWALANPNLLISQRDNDVGDVVYGNTAVLVTTPYLAMWASTGTAYAMRLSGIAQTVNVSAGADSGDWFADTSARDNVVLGARQRLGGEDVFFKGDLAEVIIYDGVTLTADEIGQVETYLADRWEIALP